MPDCFSGHGEKCQVRSLNEMTPEELKKQGWQKRFTASEPRVSEAVELYESMGFEVLVLPATPEDMNEAGCDACLDTLTVKTIYTRKLS